MKDKIRWGIIGTGAIAKQLARALAILPDAELVAVGSRKTETAKAFGEEFKVRKCHASYEDLAKDPEVDVVYVSTPHNLHCANTVLALNHGKAALCEKPFAINAGETEKMIRLARSKKLFLMEAMWTRFIPIVVKVREWLKQGVIGEVRMLSADFGFRAGWNEESRLLNPELGGGSLLDVGIYAVSFASMVFGEPQQQIASAAHLGQTGVDEQAAMILKYSKGQLAQLACAVRTNTPQEVTILGTEGSIRIHSPFWKGTAATLTVSGKSPERVEVQYEGNGYNFEAQEVMNCLRTGKLESGVMPLDETLQIMKTMDAIRAQWGLKYPMEGK
ncbi:MAG: Gfo/Idh/MocA family oxidoreductase [Candidatus Hydrogenedentes bacterium]|nr:Gfo/Idh/MocA family oxidoreductase [Candidatus Hydrogenedentota bacterium]